MVRNISGEINLDKKQKVFLLESSKSDVCFFFCQYIVDETYLEIVYPNFSFTIMIIFTVIQVTIMCM